MIGMAPLAANFEKSLITIDFPLNIIFYSHGDQISRQNGFRFKNEMSDMWAVNLVNFSLGDV